MRCDQNNITDIHRITSKEWPQESVVPLMAMAQHPGVPTRLLDWSSNPYVASYHAAAPVVSQRRDEVKANGKIAVFALDLRTLPRINEVKHMSVAGSTSAYLCSQTGSFLLVDNSRYRGEAFTPDVSVEPKLGINASLRKRIALPATLAGNLLFRCGRFGISAASVFPRYDGIGRPVLESTLAWNFSHVE